MKKLLLFFSALFLFTSMVFYSFDSFVPLWSAADNILKPVRAGNTASYSKNNNGWLLIVSGRDENDAILKTVQRYNVNSNSWDTLNPHPTGLLGAAATVLKDSLYIIGGVVNPPGAGENLVYKLNINQNVWSTVANFPVSIVDAKAVSYQDSLIYTAGGFGGPVEQNIYLYNSS
jgi:N-acetylneuraminic acid mutarotase